MKRSSCSKMVMKTREEWAGQEGTPSTSKQRWWHWHLSLHEAGRSLNLTAICEDGRLGNCSLSHKGIVTGFLAASVTRVRDGSMYTPTSVLSFYHRMLKGRRAGREDPCTDRGHKTSFITTLNSRSPKNFFYFPNRPLMPSLLAF